MLVHTMALVRGLAFSLKISTLLTSVCIASELQAQQQPGLGRTQPQNSPRQQDDGRSLKVTVNKPVTEQQTHQSKDAMIAGCMAVSNGEEIALAKLAASKTENDKVRDFAEKMIDDHSKMLAKLERFGGHAGVAEGVERDRNDEVLTSTDRADRANTQQRSQSGFDFVNMKRQIAQECLASAQKCWEEKKGSEADMAYIGQQLVMHQQMLDAGKVMKQYASSDLQQVIENGMEKAKEHKEHCEKLIEELAHEKTASKN
jgi:predicted outer membrane protein